MFKTKTKKIKSKSSVCSYGQNAGLFSFSKENPRHRLHCPQEPHGGALVRVNPDPAARRLSRLGEIYTCRQGAHSPGGRGLHVRARPRSPGGRGLHARAKRAQPRGAGSPRPGEARPALWGETDFTCQLKARELTGSRASSPPTACWRLIKLKST